MRLILLTSLVASTFTLGQFTASSVSAAATPSAPPVALAGTSRTIDPELGDLVAGETSMVDGTHVWTDYAYDDRGPNTDALPGGDAAYPSAPHPANTADLIQLQLGTARRGGLEVRAVLETLVPKHEVLAGVGLDTDDNPTTGAHTMPGGQWRTRESLGLERVVLFGSDGRATLLTWRAGRWASSATMRTQVGRKRNSLRVVVPGLKPGRATWNVVGVAGRLEAGKSWRTGDLPIQDLAYLRAEDPIDQVILSVPQSLPPAALQPFQDHIQADTLAAKAPAHRAVASVRFGTHRDRAPGVRDGYNAFLYHSRVPVPEGVATDPRVFNGIYQPYGVWLPANLPARPSMVVFLHGADQYHNVNVAYFSNPESIGIPSPYDVRAAVIFPNGRTTNWGTPVSDRDALDAMDDAIARLRVNKRRVVVSGVSSGGYGTYHLASRYPDRFTGAYSLVGGTGLGSGPVAAVENLTNVPFRASNGLVDPLVNVSIWRTSADALEAAKTVDYRIVLVHNRSHDGPLAEGNCYLQDLLSRNAVRRPGRIRFRVPAYDAGVRALGLQPTHAYWATGLRPRTTTRSGSIDVSSAGRRGQVVTQDAISEFGENATQTSDFCGAHPTMRNGNNWDIEGRSFRRAPAPPVRNRMSVTLENLASAKLDLRRAGIRLNRSLRVTVTSDGPSTVRLEGYHRALRVTAGKRAYVVRPNRR